MSRISSFRERIGDLIGGRTLEGKIKQLQSVVNDLEAYRMSPQAALKRISELDRRLFDLLLSQQGYTVLKSPTGQNRDTSERLRLVELSRWMYADNLMAWTATRIFTDFGFGQIVTAKAVDPTAQVVWDEFWGATRNSYVLGQAELHYMSNTLLTDGELFLAVYTAKTGYNEIETLGKPLKAYQVREAASKAAGRSTIRLFKTTQVGQIIYSADDDNMPLLYVVDAADTDDGVSRILFRDWRATDRMIERYLESHSLEANEILADDYRPETAAVIIPIQINKTDGRGIPQFSRVFGWMQAYNSFVEDRATIARVVAMFVEKLKVDGGSAAIDEIAASLQSGLVSGGSAYDRNPSPVAGSMWLENENATLERRPLDTGAGDAKQDSIIIGSQIAAATSIPMHYLGRSDTTQNRAVAKEAGKPFTEQMERYQVIWASAFTQLATVVLRGYEAYNNVTFTDTLVDVSLQTPMDTTIGEIEQVINAVNSSVNTGTLDIDTANTVNRAMVMLSVNKLGVQLRDDDAAAIADGDYDSDYDTGGEYVTQ